MLATGAALAAIVALITTNIQRGVPLLLLQPALLPCALWWPALALLALCLLFVVSVLFAAKGGSPS